MVNSPLEQAHYFFLLTAVNSEEDSESRSLCRGQYKKGGGAG
jgi:hypothetical protein